MSDLVDAIEFRATAKSTPLPMLDEALAKLRAIGSQLDALNGKIAGLSTMSAFKRTKDEMADLIKSSTPLSKRIPIKTVAEILGVPDIKDFQTFMSRWKAAHKDAAKSVFSGAGGSEFASPSKAAELARKYFTSAQSRAGDQVAQLQALFGKGSFPEKMPTPPPVAPVAPAIPVPTAIPKSSGTKRKAKAAAAEEMEGNPREEFRNAMAQINNAMAQAIASPSAQGITGGSPEQIAAAHAKAASEIRGLVRRSGLPEGGKATEDALARAANFEKKAEDLRQKQMADSMKKVGRIRADLAKARERGDDEEAARLNSERRQMERRIASQNKMLASGQKSQDAKAKEAQKLADFEARQIAERQAARDAVVRRKFQHASAQGELAEFLSNGGIVSSDRNAQIAGAKGMRQQRIVTATRDFAGQRHTLTATFDENGASVKRFTRALSEARKESGYLAGDFLKNTATVTLWAASVGVLYKSLNLANYSMSRMIDISAQMARLDQVFRGVGGSTQELTSDILHLAAVNGRSTQEALASSIQWARLGLTRVQVNEAVRVSLLAANVAELSAADATEHLQAIMQNYQLKVGDLRTVLGELNQISNTFNVTNADMFEGLSRTASIAKQAGLPLAELMGLIGATVGGTGQSGSNIGNAIKSITAALGNPTLQKTLKNEFGFNATTNGEQIKNLSALLSDLFVKYNHLNDAQRQSLLFQLAGKNQASRLAALLDNYVRAQTLAINSQLNLNSAESENAKIKATLRAQLQGLTAEWERFVAIQGNRGPVKVMTEMSSALRNLLTLMNTKVGSGAITGILGLLAAGGIKSVLTGMALKNGGGFLSRSGAAIRGSLGNLNQSMVALYAGALGGTSANGKLSGVYEKDALFNIRKQARDTLGHGRFSGPIGSIMTAPLGLGSPSQLYIWSEALMRVGKSGAISSKAVKVMATAFGSVTRAIGAGLIALESWLIPLGIITVATVAFNAGMEKLGLSSEKAESKLAGFNAQAQRAASAAAAFSEAAQLISTAQNAIKGQEGFQNMQPEDAKKMLDQVAEVAFVNEPLDKQKKLTEELTKQFDILLKQKDTQGILNLLESDRNKLVSSSRDQLQDKFEAIQKSEAEVDAEIKRLKAAARGPLGSFEDASRQKKIAEFERQKQDLASAKVENILEQTHAYDSTLEHDTAQSTALQTHKLQVESIAEIFNSVSANNPLEKMGIQVASLNAQLDATHNYLEELKVEDKRDTASDVESAKAVKELQASKNTAREQLSILNKKKAASLQFNQFFPSYDPKNPTSVPGTNIAQVQRDIDAQEAQISKLDAQITEAKKGRLPENELGFEARSQQRTKATDRIQKLQSERDALLNNRPIISAQTQFQYGMEQARRAIIPSAVGFDEGDKLQRQRRALEKESKRLESKPKLNLDEQSRLLENQRELYQTILALRQRAYTTERDINELIFQRAREFQRSLFDAGPSELLKKLAAFRTAFDNHGHLRNISAGAMMSFSPEFRKEVVGAQFTGIANGAKSPGGIFDSSMMNLLNERNRLKFFKGEGVSGEWDRYQNEISGKIGQLAEKLSKTLGAIPLDTFNAAAAAMSKVATAVNDKLLPAFDSLIAKINSVPGAVGATGGGQYNGRGGAAGYGVIHTT